MAMWRLRITVAVFAALGLWACGGGPATPPPPAETASPRSKAATTPAETPAAAPASPVPAGPPAATEPAAPPAAIDAQKAAPAPASAKAINILVAGADGHGKSTLIDAIARVLAKPTDGRARNPRQSKVGGVTHLSFDAGGREVVLLDFPSHADVLAAIGSRRADLGGLLLVVAQAEGLMKQTREQIEAAGKRGLRPLAVVQTKDDLIDDAELKDLELGEIEQALVDAGLLAEKDAGTWEKGKFVPGPGLRSFRVSARNALAGDAAASRVIATLVEEVERRAAPARAGSR